MAQIIILAFAAAVYPTLLAAVIVILSQPSPARTLMAFLLGGMVTSITIGVVLLQAIGNGHDTQQTARDIGPATDLIVGCVALLLAVAVTTRRPQRVVDYGARRRAAKAARAGDVQKESWTRRTIGSGSLTLAVAAGAVLNLPSAWYLMALKDIAAGGYKFGAQLLLIVVFNVIMFLLVEVPLVAYIVAPERAQRAVNSFDEWLRGHRRQIIITVLAVIGAYLVIKGLVAL